MSEGLIGSPGTPSVEVNPSPAPAEPTPAPAPAEPTPVASTEKKGILASMTSEDFKSRSRMLREAKAPENNPETPPAEPPKTEPEPSAEPPKAEPGSTPVTKFTLPDGEELTLEQIQEMKKGNMLQADYTKKTQELAEQRKQMLKFKDKPLDEAVALWERMESDPVGTIEFLRNHYAERGITEPKDPAVLKVEMELAKKDEELKQATQEKEAREAHERVVAFNQYMEGLINKYKEHGIDTKKVMEYCINKNIADPEVGFKALIADKVAAENQKLKEDVQKKGNEAVGDYIKDKLVKNDGFTPPVGSGSTGTAVTVPPKPKTFGDARKSALARLGAR